MVSLQCDPQGVGNKMSPCPRVFGATPLDLWLRNGHPQGVPTPTNPARWVTDPIDPYRRVPTPTNPARWVTDPIDPYRRVTTPTDPYRWVTTPTDPYRWVTTPTDPYRWVTTPTDPYRWVRTSIVPARWVPAPTDPYRWVMDHAFIALYRWVEDPARDLRFIATGRAATAAMTCGQTIVRTATPCGSH